MKKEFENFFKDYKIIGKDGVAWNRTEGLIYTGDKRDFYIAFQESDYHQSDIVVALKEEGSIIVSWNIKTKSGEKEFNAGALQEVDNFIKDLIKYLY